MNFNFKSLTVSFVLAIAMIAISAAPVQADLTPANVDTWVGSGSNTAYMLIDWKDGSARPWQLYGYRWDGVATGQDMLMAIAGEGVIIDAVDGVTQLGTLSGADANLRADLRRYGFGDAIDGLTYDRDGDDQPLDGSDPDDNRQHGFDAGTVGYWGYWSSTDGSNWGFASAGMGDRVLSNGDWDGWAWAPNFESTSPVPEPATLCLLALGGVALGLRRRLAVRG